MLILSGAETPGGTVRAVLDFISSEAERYRQQARTAEKPSARAIATGKVNALLTMHMQLADCDVMQREPNGR